MGPIITRRVFHKMYLFARRVIKANGSLEETFVPLSLELQTELRTPACNTLELSSFDNKLEFFIKTMKLVARASSDHTHSK